MRQAGAGPRMSARLRNTPRFGRNGKSAIPHTMENSNGDRSGDQMKPKKIGILTGGGDVPGLNSVIKTVVYHGYESGCEVTGIRRGWEGLTHVNFDDPASVSRYIIPLNRDNTRTIDRTGGTWLHSSRTNPLKMKNTPAFLSGANFPAAQNTKGGVTSTVYDMTSQVMKSIEKLELDYLIAIAG